VKTVRSFKGVVVLSD